MSTTRNKMVEEIEQYYHTPSAIQQIALDYLEEATNGKMDLVDPSNPFMFLLEASATNTSAAILKNESVARELYPLLAGNYKDLYHHMSDVDYLDRFASPSRTRFNLVIPVETFKANAIVDSLTNVRRVRIPKDTVLSVGGLDWYTHRAIEISMAGNGVIQVYYDLATDTPLVDDSTNLLSYYTTETQEAEWLIIQIPVEQLSTSVHTLPLSSSTGFNVTLAFTNQFYAVRAYRRISVSSAWEEIVVTHSDQVYDPGKVTIRAVVEEGAVRLQSPEVYLEQGNVAESFLIVVYTTQGEISIDLADYSSDSFSGRFTDITTPTDPYIAPIANMTDLQIYNEEAVVGGRDELDFNSLRDRVIYRSADQRASITFEELGFQLEDMGYSLTKAKDVITQRQYICSRGLPSPTSARVQTPIGVRHASVLIDSAREDLQYCFKDNGLRKTLSQRTIYKENSGVVELVSDYNRGVVDTYSNDELSVFLNNNPHYYSPFVYVLNSDKDLYMTRVYYLDRPVSPIRNYIDSNIALPFAVNTQSVKMVRYGDIFQLSLVAALPNGVTGIKAQIKYSDNSGRMYYMTVSGVEVGTGFMQFVFNLESTLDITEDNRIEILSMTGPSTVEESVFLPLTSKFDVYYLYESITATASLFELEYNKFNLGDVVGVTHEDLTVTFGTELNKLFMRSRATIIPSVYEVYDEDIPKYHERDIYLRDENGVPVWTMDDSERPVLTKLVNMGDPVLDDEGQTVYAHLTGETKLDSSGNPVVKEPERLLWEITPLLLDAKYYFATSAGAIEYRESIPTAILGYLSRDIVPLNDKVMARTDMMFQPTASTGVVRINFDGKLNLNRETALKFQVTYMLEPGAYEDNALRSRITSSTTEVIVSAINNSTFSTSELIRRLKENGGEYVVDVAINDVLNGYKVGVLLPENTHFSVFSELVPLSNGTMDVVDAIDVAFIKKIEE